ncbi:helix-turn-helix domain-containing protein [Agromyces sp. LHK192]|uniref:winged helix-turn-helix transcriptional regulator n=1 Tax=Agromyces sp. LHK192 TaxID=2498704 RepID=UPI000FDCC28A|nr:winged helix-turn-helix transcriptional regulator [Agromyces sp. LHK192]
MVNRSYDDGCAAAHALDLVGERWALLVVRELLFGPKRFTDLRTGLPGASPNVLALRLRELESNGIVSRRRLPPPAATVSVYELTPWGTQLEPVIIALGRWGGRSPSLDPDAPISVDSVMLALKTSFSPDLAEGFDAEVTVRMREDVFDVRVSAGEITIRRGEAGRADAVVTADPATINDIVWNGRPLDDGIDAGDLSITGDRGTVERLVTLFPLPEPASARPAGAASA